MRLSRKLEVSDLEQTNVLLIQAIEQLQDSEVDSLIEAAFLKNKHGTGGYNIPSPGELKKKFSGWDSKLTKYTVQRLRKEFLQLMRSASKIKNYNDAEKMMKAFEKWHQHFEEVVFQVKRYLRFVAGMSSSSPDMKSEAESFINSIDKIWGFVSELRVPLDSVSKEKSRWYDAPEMIRSKEQLFKDSIGDIKKWSNRVKRKSRVAWKWLNDVSDWSDKGDSGVSLKYRKGQETNMNISGFSVKLEGFDPETDQDKFSNQLEKMGRLKRALKVYKDSASRRFPWLLKYKLPFVAKFYYDDSSAFGVAGSYENNHIILEPTSFRPDPKETVRVIAHEMGHHIYRTFLSEKMRNDWWRFLKSKNVDLDLRKVVAMKPPKESWYDFVEKLEKKNPILALQLHGLANAPGIGYDEIEDYLSQGRDPIVRVSSMPITGYAGKNTEEAFCEALGMLVGYGPRVLPEGIRAALKVLFPKLRVESLDGGGNSGMKVERANYLLGRAIAGFQDDEIDNFVSAFEEVDDPDFEVASDGKKGIPVQCMECGHKFRKKIGRKTISVRCSECGSHDTEIE